MRRLNKLSDDQFIQRVKRFGMEENMFEGYQDTEELTRNLADAGCSKMMITCFLSCLLNGDKAGSLGWLEKRRSELLEEIHKEQSCIEFLNEQIYSLRGQTK